MKIVGENMVEFNNEQLEILKQLGKEAKASPDQLAQLSELKEKDMIERGVPEEEMPEMVFKAMQSTLKKPFEKVKEPRKDEIEVSGFLIGRAHATDWAAIERRKIDKIIKEKGYTEDHAVEAGLKNEKGEYLWKDHMFKKGILPEHDYNNIGYGFINVNGKEKFTIFKYFDESSVEKIELWKKTKINVVLKDSEDENKYVVAIYETPTKYEKEYVNYFDYADLIEKVLGKEMVIPSLQVFEDSLPENADFNDWMIVKGDITNIKLGQFGDLGIAISDDSLSLGSGDKPKSYTIWLPKDIEIDLDEDAIGVIFFIKVPQKELNGKLKKIYGIGYWVKVYFRKVVDPDSVDPQKAWE
jgi:hypothetical protein